MAENMLVMEFMNSGHLPVSESAARGNRKTKARRGRPRSKTAPRANGHAAEPQLAAAGSLTRTKALLLAALRVWELKHRVNE
jgi:hypothetical protein